MSNYRAMKNYRAMNNYHATLAEAMAQVPDPEGNLFAGILSHGSMEVEIYVPQKVDPQQPHTRDELYFVAKGEGMFVNGDQRHPFKAGDVLFVPAGVVHRFEDFTDDFVTWVVFYGPEGGEASNGVRG